MTMKRLAVVFGTRPEAIKLAPVILAARQRPEAFDTRVIVTAQHREMLDDVLEAFGISPDIDLNIMSPDQSLFDVTAGVLKELEPALGRIDADIVMVQGDTTTAFAAALAGYYLQKKVAHVEAGLRTGDKYAPFPEEINRRMAACVADYHFAPTEGARENLLREGYPPESITVTGNTVIDALLLMREQVRGAACPVAELAPRLESGGKMVLITGHRRENFGAPFERICRALLRLAKEHPETAFVYPVHLNPNVQRPVRGMLGGVGNFHLIAPLPYPQFVWFMERATLIITDSGGVQEEAPALGKPVLVTRRKTERPEAVEAGVVKLTGDDEDVLFAEADRLLRDTAYYKAMARGMSPYGDGKASARILDVLTKS